MDPVTGFAAVSGLLNVLKEVTGIAKGVNSGELNSRIADMQLKVLDVQEKLLALQADNFRLTEANRKLQSDADRRGCVVFLDHAQWEKNEDGTEDGPFCPSCWSGDGILHRAAIRETDGQVVLYKCSKHSESYYFRVPAQLVKSGDLTPYRRPDNSF